MGYVFMNVSALAGNTTDPVSCGYNGTYPPITDSYQVWWGALECARHAPTVCACVPPAQDAYLYAKNPFAADITINGLDFNVWWTAQTEQNTSFLAHARGVNQNIVIPAGTPPRVCVCCVYS